MPSRRRILMFMDYYYSTDLHRGVAQYALEAGWCLNASMYRGGRVPNFRWDGIVGCFQERDEFFDTHVKPMGIPAVSLTVTRALPSVLPNHRSIGALGAEHLLELGYRNFAFYFKESNTHELQRAEAFQERLNPAVHRFYRINHTATPRVRRQPGQSRLRVLRRRLRELPKPVAVMAPIDDLAVEVIETCEDLGLHVPKEVGVLGVNNDRLICDLTHVPLSSVDDDEYRIGYEGAALLDRLMRGARPPRRPVTIEPKGVVIRKSTDLLVRFITGEPAEMATRARALIEKSESGAVALRIVPLVVAETVFVLAGKVYGFDRREVATALIQFIESPSLEVEQRDALIAALRLFRDHTLDFVDACLAAQARLFCVGVASFDADFARIAGLELAAL